MKRLLFLIFCLLPGAQAAEQAVAELGPEFWFTPRHGDVIAGRADIGMAVKHLLGEPEAYLVLRYPETESGELWGQELQAWLVSLGVVSDRIELQPDAQRLESLQVVLVSPALTPAASEADVDENPEVHADPDVEAEADPEAESEAESASPPGASPEAVEQEPAEDVQVETE